MRQVATIFSVAALYVCSDRFVLTFLSRGPAVDEQTGASPPLTIARDAPTFTLSQIFVLALGVGAVSAAYAALEARDLDADGTFFLLKALTDGGVAFIDPARKTVQCLQQLFVLIGIKLGLTDLLAYGRLLTLGTQGWPVGLTALAWFALPPRHKSWILGPLLNYAVVMPTTSYMGVSEGMVTSGLLWILFFLVEFRDDDRTAAMFGIAVALLCIYSQEAAAPFMAGIAWLALRRAQSSNGLRGYYATIAAIALIAALNLFYHIVFARSPFERGAFLVGLLIEFLATPAGPGINLSSVAAICVALGLLSVHFPGRDPVERRQRRSWTIVKISCCIFASIALLFVLAPEWVMVRHAYFAARGLPVVATTVMAATVHILRRREYAPDELAPKPVRWLLIAIIAMQFVVQTQMTKTWIAYRRDMAALVAARRGPIDWDTASRTLDPQHTVYRNHLVRAWSLQPLSIVMAPHGHVQAIVDARPGIMWKPFDPTDASSLPLCARGLDWSGYIDAIHYTGPPRTKPDSVIRCP